MASLPISVVPVSEEKHKQPLVNNLDELKAEMVRRGNGRPFRPCWCGHIGDHYGVWHQTPPCAHCDAWEKDAKSASNKDGHTVYCPNCGAGHWVKLGYNPR